MQEIRSRDEFHREVKSLRLHLRCEAAARRVRLVLYRMRDAARERERKYSPDQPRAPRGTPIGGQWIVDPSSARQRRRLGEILRTAGISEDLEELGGGVPVLRISPKGATQFVFPNGMILRFDLVPGQYLPGQVPHINLHYNGVNHHINLR